ncbi:MAG: STAS domain-containing protein, partial [Lysobacter sp.]
MTAAVATMTRDAETLVFRGALERSAIAALWRQAQALRANMRRLDLIAVSHVDSAGLALLAELAGDGIEVLGAPAGLAELRAAYRLD